jgi:hypothetical protein
MDRLPPALAASATPRVLELLGEVVVIEPDPSFAARARERGGTVADRAEGRFDAAVAPVGADLSEIDVALVVLVGADGGASIAE